MTVLSAPALFVHHVLFYTPATASEADKAILLEGLQQLVRIPSIKQAHIGTPADTTRDVIERTYTYSLLCLFDGAEQEAQYQHHPIHDEFRTQYARYWEKVVIYDAIGPVVE
ncbi:Dabb family protein [Hymenobacter mucosus]|uniref:Stress responsive A/B Barrel Domain n=1 Tax=Hymenobacter mucosus TaxID=1411120 RepID=A0A239APA8_9BACT|nr:Dabb family protein [Hymenobacter mucosus]SNR97122.1 Stress responsive A/B Barrel Domain [Hymenobacter mucosus]